MMIIRDCNAIGTIAIIKFGKTGEQGYDVNIMVANNIFGRVLNAATTAIMIGIISKKLFVGLLSL